MTMDVNFVCPSQQMHGEEQTHQTEVMITMQVTDEDVADSMKIGLIFHQLYLRTFATIDQEIAVFNLN